MPLTYIDIFAGAGGLSEGFMKNGFIPVAHVEMKAEACFTLKTRTCYYYLKSAGQMEEYNRYLKHEISRDELYQFTPKVLLDTVIQETMSTEGMDNLFKRIDELMQKQNVREIDVLVGGPPCQAYSLVGRARSDSGMEGDPRNYLYQLYADVLERYCPKMFVFENVLGLLSAKEGKYLQQMQERFRSAGYEVEYRILTASDYGVLQNRKRVILIGQRKSTDSVFVYPEIEKVGVEYEKYKVSDLLSDLCSLNPGEEKNEYRTETTEYLNRTGIRTEKDILTWHVARPIQERDRMIYRHVISAWNEEVPKRLKYTDLPEELCTHNNRTAFLDRFKVVANDLHTSQTMVAHISKDGHYFIHPDIKQARSITVREAARIQSFPDNYYFEGGRTAAFLQIGNAVPPLMAAAIAKALKKLLEDEKNRY